MAEEIRRSSIDPVRYLFASELVSTMIQQMSGDGYQVIKLAAIGMQFVITEAALPEIANAGFGQIYGARPLKRTIQA